MDVINPNSSNSSRFYGRNSVVLVDDIRIRQISPKIADIVGNILLNEPEKSSWRHVADRLMDWMQVINDPNTVVNEYQLEITKDILIPYLSKLQNRVSTDSSRSKQILEILETIMHRDIPHPAVCLQQLDKVLDELKVANQSYLFTSELLLLVQQSQVKQWRPIVMDLRAFLQDTAGKLVGISVITIIGWPMAFVSPLLFNMKKIMGMVQEFEAHQRLSSESMMLLAKIIVIMLVLMKLLSFLQVYQSLGYFCGGLAAVCMLISSNDGLIKSTAPLVAPNARLIDDLIQRFMRTDQGVTQQGVTPSAPPFPVGDNARVN